MRHNVPPHAVPHEHPTLYNFSSAASCHRIQKGPHPRSAWVEWRNTSGSPVSPIRSPSILAIAGLVLPHANGLYQRLQSRYAHVPGIPYPSAVPCFAMLVQHTLLTSSQIFANIGTAHENSGPVAKLAR